MLLSCCGQGPWIAAVRQLPGVTITPPFFRRWVEHLPSESRLSCLEQAKQLLRRACIGSYAEDGQALIAIAVIANELPPDLAQRARCALLLSDRWRWVTEEPTSPEA